MSDLAAVTGATGMVGKRIVSALIARGLRVRILTRAADHRDSRTEIVHGDLSDAVSVGRLLEGATMLFHCAAELHDETRMWQTNVEGTESLLEVAEKTDLKYICHLSSVGVIGLVSNPLVDETTECRPMNAYEKSKRESEMRVERYQGNARVVVLRPTNVVDRNRNFLHQLGKAKVFIKGGENAHLIHADDVAAAAIYFLDHPSFDRRACFILSCDEEKMNTVAGIVALCGAIKNKQALDSVKPLPHLPWVIPYLMRRATKGPCNRGDVRYSSRKILSAGFSFPRGLIGALEDLCEDT
ncbi:MAG: NAD-dependent epimerase/dehydratase family protein [Pseudomonadales bacterium]|nr:NAD-dependent epimerase/dehydratase family protein [Pseudomonadales bacterium]